MCCSASVISTVFHTIYCEIKYPKETWENYITNMDKNEYPLYGYFLNWTDLVRRSRSDESEINGQWILERQRDLEEDSVLGRKSLNCKFHSFGPSKFHIYGILTIISTYRPNVRFFFFFALISYLVSNSYILFLLKLCWSSHPNYSCKSKAWLCWTA